MNKKPRFVSLGGGWGNNLYQMRATYRGFNTPGYCSGYMSFRLKLWKSS